MKTVVIEGMMCPHCQARVQQILTELSGKTVEVNLEEKTAMVPANVADEKIIKAINNGGYKVIDITCD